MHTTTHTDEHTSHSPWFFHNEYNNIYRYKRTYSPGCQNLKQKQATTSTPFRGGTLFHSVEHTYNVELFWIKGHETFPPSSRIIGMKYMYDGVDMYGSKRDQNTRIRSTVFLGGEEGELTKRSLMNHGHDTYTGKTSSNLPAPQPQPTAPP